MGIYMDTAIMMGLIEFFRSASEKSSLPRSDFRDNDQRTLYSTGIDYAPCNGIIEKKEAGLKHNDVKEAVNFFSKKNLPFVWWSSDTFLETQGFQFGGTMKGIALDIKNSIPASHALPGVKVKVVNTEQELNAFCKVIAECFGFTSDIESQYARMSKLAMDKKEQVHFLAYVDDVPVSTATLTTLPKSAGIWNCATLPMYRKKGIGTFLCSLATKQAKEMNYHDVMAILMPKGLAWGPFNKLGFREVSSLPFYVYGAAAHELEK